MRSYYLSRSIIFFVLPVILFINACGTSSPQPGNEENPPEEIPSTEAVPPDGILEAVTWNIERYGSNESFEQTQNAVWVLDTLDADLYALQEIHSQEALDNLLDPLTGYKGFTAEHVNRGQQMAFIYNTNTIDSLEAGPISNVRDEYQQDWEYAWANGREPLYFRFNYISDEEQTTEFFAVVIHAKANTSNYRESYERRQQAAEGLYYHLMDEQPNANIILLGDYNDDVDESIFYYDDPDNFAETPYDEFMENSQNFEVVTHILSKAGESSYLGEEGGKDLIDHIMMSDELFQLYIDGSADVYDAPLNYIPDFEESTSDHLPVWVKFEMENEE